MIPSRSSEDKDKYGDLYPVIALEHSGMSFEDGQRLISAFINSVAWVRKAGINTAQFGGGSRVHGLGGPDAQALYDDHFELNYVPDPTDKKARLALAFYREGLNLNSVAYQCLSFFKILNITLQSSKAQKKWIDTNIKAAMARDKVRTYEWQKKSDFDPKKETAGSYLYVSNRCAVAHAYNYPLIDPDDPLDRRRLACDLPMVRALAEHFIEQEFGVKSSTTVWREHFYELAGFGEIFGANLIDRIKAGEEVPLEDFPDVPLLSVRLAFHERFPSFEEMGVRVIDCADGTVNLELTSTNQLVSILLVLNFGTERLDFEIFDHLATEDDSSYDGAQAELDKLRFIDFYLMNGKLEIWAGMDRLSRKEAYLPVNVDLNATHKSYQEMILTAEKILAKRNS
ncbi:methylamine utilization protein MauJ [Lentilitoribacter sp. EG35]|uniref:methylamine utilization protein MauJ n=1 Tax=Lentilitoribacter sp. EG35 TaxID=3234192 RepID=UPI00345F721F